MTEISERWRKVGARFSEVARAVPGDAWDHPAPCEGWVARDVVRHLIEWMPPMFLEHAPAGPSVDDDPVGAWEAARDAIQAALDDPEAARRELENQAGRFTVEHAVDTLGTGDVVLHTWDLARATGQDETLDPVEVHRLFDGIEQHDEAMRASGHFGPRVPVPDDASEQTKLIAFIGRQP